MIKLTELMHSATSQEKEGMVNIDDWIWVIRAATVDYWVLLGVDPKHVPLGIHDVIGHVT